MRRCRDVLADHLADMAGADNCSVAERSILRRASVLTAELEMIEVKFANGQSTLELIETYQRCANTLRRLFETVGLKRRSKDVTPLSDILRELDREKAEAAAAAADEDVPQ